MYTVKQLDKDNFQIAKFEDRKEPESVYLIRKGKCNCPASFRSKTCKHQKLVSAFKELEEGPWAFDFVGDKIQPYYLAFLDLQ